MISAPVPPISPPETFSHPANELGECPRWHPLENRLYWTDIETSRIYRQSPADHSPEILSFDFKVGCFGFAQAGGFILATSSGIKRLESDTQSPIDLVDPEAGKKEARFNDGQVDPAGRFWAGTMTETDASSCLYCLDVDHRLTAMVRRVTISNGIGWNPAHDRMYFTDTLIKTIWVFPFDLETGALGQRKVFIRTKGPGLPDGLCVDVDGNLWSVQCGTGMINVYSPEAKLMHQINFPTRCITACTFGGQNLQDLYVTSSRSLLSPEERDLDALAGAVFRVQTGTSGMPLIFFGG